MFTYYHGKCLDQPCTFQSLAIFLECGTRKVCSLSIESIYYASFFLSNGIICFGKWIFFYQIFAHILFSCKERVEKKVSLLLNTENAKYLDEISKKYPSPTRVWMGPNLYIFVHDAESAEQVLKGRTTLSKPKVYEAIRDALGGDGLFSSNGNVFSLSYSFVKYRSAKKRFFFSFWNISFCCIRMSLNFFIHSTFSHYAFTVLIG